MNESTFLVLIHFHGESFVCQYMWKAFELGKERALVAPMLNIQFVFGKPSAFNKSTLISFRYILFACEDVKSFNNNIHAKTGPTTKYTSLDGKLLLGWDQELAAFVVEPHQSSVCSAKRSANFFTKVMWNYECAFYSKLCYQISVCWISQNAHNGCRAFNGNPEITLS